MFFLKTTCKLWEQLPQGQWPSQTTAFLLSNKDGKLMSEFLVDLLDNIFLRKETHLHSSNLSNVCIDGFELL